MIRSSVVLGLGVGVNLDRDALTITLHDGPDVVHQLVFLTSGELDRALRALAIAGEGRE